MKLSNPKFNNIFLTICGLVTGVFLSEVALRLIGFSFLTFSAVDPYLGAILRANAEGWSTQEGKAYIRINNQGFRDRNHSKIKPNDTYRVAVLGDSYAEARQLPMEETFWAITEVKLGKCLSLPMKKVEFLNFGVSGQGTDRELLSLRHKVWDYNPDLILVAFTPGNDIRNNSFRLEEKKELPFFYFKEGELRLDNSFRNSKEYLNRKKLYYEIIVWVYYRSRVLQLIKKVWNDWKEGLLFTKHNSEGEERGLDNNVYKVPENDIWQEAWKITEELFVLIGEEVREKGVKMFIVTLTNGIQVYPDKSVRDKFKEKLGVKNLFYPGHRIKMFGEKHKIPVLNLAQVFQEYADKNEVFLHGFENSFGRGHWNTEGHQLAGDKISEFICKNFENMFSHKGTIK